MGSLLGASQGAWQPLDDGGLCLRKSSACTSHSTRFGSKRRQLQSPTKAALPQGSQGHLVGMRRNALSRRLPKRVGVQECADARVTP